MTQAHLTRLWLAVGLVLVFYSLNTWIVSRGGKPLFGVDLLSEARIASELLAIPICAVLLALLCQVGIVYAGRSGAWSWHARMPVIGLDGLKTGAREGRLYQAFFLFLFIALPTVALAYFTARVLGGRVFDRCGGPELTPLSPVSWDVVASKAYWDDGYRLGADADHAVTWFPVLEPAMLALLLLLAAVQGARFLVRLFGR